MIESHTLSVAKTAHYYTIGTPGKHIQKCWIVCHGQGQLAQYFIRKFDGLAAEDTFILAPEGFSRYYLNGFSGKVGASWMTKEDRLTEIEDYSNYLTILYQQFIPQFSDHVALILFGFSQGCATQLRWVMRAFPHFHRLVLWAGMLPEDLDYQAHQDYFADKKLHFVYGTNDPFITTERMQQIAQLIENHHLNVEIQTFEGEHTVDRSALQALVTNF